MYTVQNCCMELPDMHYDDGLQFLYFYTSGTKGGNADIKVMLDYFKHSTINNTVNEATREIHEYISKVKISPEAEVAFMKYDDLVWVSETRGRKEGRIEGHREVLLEMIAELSPEFVGVPEDVRKKVEEQTDAEVLKKWLKLAAKATSLEDWKERIEH